MPTSSPEDPMAMWMAFWKPWIDLGTGLVLAPQQLAQSINSGWSFGNVIVNTQNSRAPGTEQAILSQVSYGRQLGKLLDAMCVLIEERRGEENKALEDVVDLQERIETIKKDTALRGVERLAHQLETLRNSDNEDDRQAMMRALDGLRGLVKELEAKG